MDSTGKQPTRRTGRKQPSQIAGASRMVPVGQNAPAPTRQAQPRAAQTASDAPRRRASASEQQAPRRANGNMRQNAHAAPRTRQTPTSKHAAQRPPRRKRPRRWPWVVAIAVVVALWIPVIGWFTGILPNPAEQVAETPEVQAEVEIDPSAGTAAIESIAQQGTDFIPRLKQEDLSWRDAEFAVDPSRDTEWNFEPNGRKVVYLTIDDGPSENTQAVLDILDKYDCKATFFVTGIDPDHAYQIKEEYQRGHTVGLHTYSHDYAQVYASQDAYFADLEAIGNVVKEQIGFVPCFIRFPGGSSNGVSADYAPGIMSALVDEVNARGYQYYDWNASSGDGSDHTADELYGYACEYDDLDNVVLLIHDSSTKQTTVEALPRIIEHYQGLGYTFEAIDRTTIVPHHGVNN